jgi:hypothetical protein
MYYFIFSKDLPNSFGTLYKIAENESDLNYLNINQSDYKIIQDTLENFNNVKYGKKSVRYYDSNDIIFYDILEEPLHSTKQSLEITIGIYKEIINLFLQNNSNHLLFNRWNDYYNQLSSLNLDSIIYPLNKSLEQYLNDLGQPSYNILQIP